jgi:hypothetical protein
MVVQCMMSFSAPKDKGLSQVGHELLSGLTREKIQRGKAGVEEEHWDLQSNGMGDAR